MFQSVDARPCRLGWSGWAILFTVGSLWASAAYGQDGCRMAGKWKSNEALTIADMKKHGHVTDEQRRVLADGFFGRLVHEFTCSKGRTYFAEKGPKNAAWLPYRVLEKGRNYVVLGDPGGKRAQGVRFEFVGRCFKLPVAKLGFDEFFCRANSGNGIPIR